MLGKTVLFVPGFDHAGISTQSVVEKRLWKTAGKTRHDLGRPKFVETVMDWKNEYVVTSTSVYLVIELDILPIKLPRSHNEPTSPSGW